MKTSQERASQQSQALAPTRFTTPLCLPHPQPTSSVLYWECRSLALSLSLSRSLSVSLSPPFHLASLHLSPPLPLCLSPLPSRAPSPFPHPHLGSCE